ncbi:hypothetical protein [Pararhodobacter aggregans]|uniref:Uncharacterized protein n=1 Tax=Pararhodobacter aggregans TaxID=404875 RepID=A0A2T7UWJ9_9RHOB|nr:hypothetical protein [Pararhodobacter aggregans]PTX04608.1 hypothetical protein C8N33_10116 [Pararhodobacter aggregans]PVE48949.1 hypothetical protein DDE23_00645 [Pararhodobacter aggregans]
MDMVEIGAAIGLASQAVGLTGKAAEAVASIKGLFRPDGSVDTEEAKRQLNALAAELTAANMANVQISGALRKLSDELNRADEFQSARARYELIQTENGDYLFRLRADDAAGEPTHYICPVCLNKDKVFSFVRVSGAGYGTCQADKQHIFLFNVQPKEKPNPAVRGRSSSWMTR